MRLDGARGLHSDESGDVRGSEVLADDGAALENRPLAGTEAVEADGKQSLQRLRQRALDHVLQGEGEKLLEEKRIALGGVDDLSAPVGLEDAAAETLEERLDLVARQRLGHDLVG